MNNLYNINGNYKNKYNYILNYLKEDNAYWLENDRWNLTKTSWSCCFGYLTKFNILYIFHL